MYHFFKRCLTPLLLMVSTQIPVASADTIRVIGSNGEISDSPRFSEQIRQPVAQGQPSLFYGPTRGNETLWSIASALRPANSLTVQQTLLAIYRLNPQAFEDQNIHGLVPGSTLRIPSLQQVQSESTADAVRIMSAHQARLDSQNQVATTRPAVRPRPVEPPKPVVEPKANDPATEVNAQPKPEMKDDGQVVRLKEQLDMSESELSTLEEKNHQLRLMLSEVQGEVETLKEELSDEDRIKNEVEKLLEAEKLKQLESQQNAPTLMEQIVANPLLLGALALIPGLLIVLLLNRRKDPEPEEQTEEQPKPEIPPVQANEDEEIDEINLDYDLIGDIKEDELSLDDELFGDESGVAFSDESEEGGEKAEEVDDVFGDLNDEDLDFNLDEGGDDPFAIIGDDGELDAEIADLDTSANGISVDEDEQALGLEEMERTLDESNTDLLDDVLEDSKTAVDPESTDLLDELVDENSTDLEEDFDPAEFDLGADTLDEFEPDQNASQDDGLDFEFESESHLDDELDTPEPETAELDTEPAEEQSGGDFAQELEDAFSQDVSEEVPESLEESPAIEAEETQPEEEVAEAPISEDTPEEIVDFEEQETTEPEPEIEEPEVSDEVDLTQDEAQSEQPEVEASQDVEDTPEADTPEPEESAVDAKSDKESDEFAAQPIEDAETAFSLKGHDDEPLDVLMGKTREEPELVMPEAVPNEFGTPQDKDCDFEDSDLSGLEEVASDEPAPLAEDLVSEISDDEENEPESIQLDDSDLGEYDEAAALQDAFSLSEDTPTAPPVTEDDLSQFDESATMATLLSEPDEGTIGGFDEPLDSKVVDSAGMDIDAMLETGEDWNGFNLTPEQQASISEDVPDEEKEVWGAAETLEEPKVDEEDWADQPELSNEGDADQKFMSVDELMAQVEREEAESGDKPDAEALELDVGLDEFPDVLGNVEPFDVDSNSEAAGKLDLAKIYVEMNDTDGAIKLLEEAIVYGDDEVRREAKSLIDKLNEN
jgi:pilus assembly protein FimV